MHVDEQLARLLDATPEPGFEESLERSRAKGLERLRERQSRLSSRRSGRSRRRRVGALATAALAAAAIAIAFASQIGRHVADPLTPTASAGVLEWAGNALVSDGTPMVGAGPVWHTVTVHHDVMFNETTEQWVDTRSPAYRRIAVYWAPRSPTSPLGSIPVVTVENWNGKSGFVRRVQRPRRGHWYAPPFGNSNEDPTFLGLGWMIDGQLGLREQKFVYVGATVSPEEGANRWARAAARAESEHELVHALRIFLRTTRGEFGNVPPDADPGAQHAVSATQIMYLLSVAQLTPQATRVMYQQLDRLNVVTGVDNSRIGDRDVLRISFDLKIPFSSSGTRRPGQSSEQPESVLVIDRSTGAPLRTESKSGKVWTSIEPAVRVARVGDERATCNSTARFVPCSVLDGEVMREANAVARSAPRMSVGGASAYGYEVDEDGLPIDEHPANPLHVATSAVGSSTGNKRRQITLLPLAPLSDDA